MITVHLKPHKEESLLRFHPWVFSGAIRSIALDKDYPYAEPREGELVEQPQAQGGRGARAARYVANAQECAESKDIYEFTWLLLVER